MRVRRRCVPGVGRLSVRERRCGFNPDLATVTILRGPRGGACRLDDPRGAPP